MKIGITGGIGSGKSYICNKFSEIYNIPIYFSDLKAKEMIIDINNRKEIINILGEKAFIDNELNKSYIRKLIFKNVDIKNKLEKYLHEKIKDDFERWYSKQKSKYVLYESALIFEKKQEKYFDKIITITVSDSIRKERVFKRDNLTNEEYELVLKNQISDDYKIKKSDFVIDNSNLSNEELNNEIKKINELCQ